MSNGNGPMATDREMSDRIYHLNEEAFDLKAEYDELAAQAKEKKKEWEHAVEEVQRLIRESRRAYPLFPEKPEVVDAEIVEPDEPEAPEPFEGDGDAPPNVPERVQLEGPPGSIVEPEPESETGPEPDPDAWRAVPLASLKGIPARTLKALAESRIETIGDVARLGEKGLSLTDVKGIGEAAAEKINAALEEFWRERGEAEAQAQAAD